MMDAARLCESSAARRANAYAALPEGKNASLWHSTGHGGLTVRVCDIKGRTVRTIAVPAGRSASVEMHRRDKNLARGAYIAVIRGIDVKEGQFEESEIRFLNN
jgi:hypothetical protein